MIVGVRILPRKEVLDSQGRAVEQTLKQHGQQVAGIRVGKYVQLEVTGSDEKQALEEARKITEFVLYNPLIETYELEVVSK